MTAAVTKIEHEARVPSVVRMRVLVKKRKTRLLRLKI